MRLRQCHSGMPRRNFRPFGVIQTFDSAEQAWALANDTSSGLVSYVWSETCRPSWTRSVWSPACYGQHADGEGIEGTVWWCLGLWHRPREWQSLRAVHTEEKTVTLQVQSQILTKLGNPDTRG